MISQSQIKEIVNKIVKNYQPEKIILFGSYATGNPTENSDIDLLIIKDSDLPRHHRGMEVRIHLRGYLFPIDILVFTPSEVEKENSLRFSFIHHVLKTGKILYE